MFEQYCAMVEMAIDLDELERPGSHSTYMIRKEHDENLALLAKTIEGVRDGLDKEHARAGRDLSLDLDKKLHLEKHERYGYCFRRVEAGTDLGLIFSLDSFLTPTRFQDFTKSVKNAKGYVELSTVKAGVLFRTEKLGDLATEYTEAADQYYAKQGELVRAIVDTACTYIPALLTMDDLIASLDVILR